MRIPLPGSKGLVVFCSASVKEVFPPRWHAELCAVAPAGTAAAAASAGADDKEARAAAAGAADEANEAAIPLILLNCRNGDESDVGRFDLAVLLDTTAFPGTWAALATYLEGFDRRPRVLTHCTGGTRCVKAGAYLGQVMGSRLWGVCIGVMLPPHQRVGRRTWISWVGGGRGDGDARGAGRELRPPTFSVCRRTWQR